MKNYRDTILNVNIDAFESNFSNYQQLTNKALFVIVKANAYGLGDVVLATSALRLGAKYLGVATLDEAVHLRKNNIQGPILVMGHVSTKYLEVALQYNITVTVISEDWAKQLSGMSICGLNLHIKINGAMNRLGLNNYQELENVIKLLKDKHNIEGIFTHFATYDPDNVDSDFNRLKQFVNDIDYEFTWVHAANSINAILYHDDLTNAVRIGIGLYGGIDRDNLKAVASLTTVISQIRKVSKGATISYGGVYTLTEPGYIATLPIGYADGLNRLDSSCEVFINNKRYPIVGVICMDQCMVLIDDTVTLDDTVEIFGNNITIDEIATRRNTINYEVLTSVAMRVPRHYYHDGKLIKTINYLLD